MAFQYYRRPWNESRADQCSSWGAVTYHFEVGDEGCPSRHIEVYDSGATLRMVLGMKRTILVFWRRVQWIREKSGGQGQLPRQSSDGCDIIRPSHYLCLLRDPYPDTALLGAPWAKGSVPAGVLQSRSLYESMISTKLVADTSKRYSAESTSLTITMWPSKDASSTTSLK